MSNATDMAEFVLVWEAVQEVHFSDLPDEIAWKWTADGVYSSQSAYSIQFAGRFCTSNSRAIWKAKAEGKHRFFAWLLVQEKIHTADVLLIKGIQCNPVCSLCDQERETAAHLSLHCCFRSGSLVACAYLDGGPHQYSGAWDYGAGLVELVDSSSGSPRQE